eukprot:CAMPEP_0198300718 /NCGR_PEP_ID=MMETSP1449-20131203/49182_1 /TAXON_ID=420275 /ORGANISM="Attheya septentrionalis, Strain CCMP2084" /LENGTH=1103 /DNA_ID=CAMNT_0044002609 /DNA_START=42 /DNA_END=3350 /DNA_ORIENTATION=-
MTKKRKAELLPSGKQSSQKKQAATDPVDELLVPHHDHVSTISSSSRTYCASEKGGTQRKLDFLPAATKNKSLPRPQILNACCREVDSHSSSEYPSLSPTNENYRTPEKPHGKRVDEALLSSAPTLMSCASSSGCLFTQKEDAVTTHGARRKLNYLTQDCMSPSSSSIQKTAEENNGKKPRHSISLQISERMAAPPDPSNLEDHQYILTLHLERDLTTYCRPVPNDDEQSEVENHPRPPLNEAQRRVAEAPANIPMSVRAGAGSGKTHTMVCRVESLVEQHGIHPSNILMLTFSNKAAKELSTRIQAVFQSKMTVGAAVVPKKYHHLPVAKTFHALACSWVHNCWRTCGLGAPLSILATNAQKNTFMQQVIEANLDQLRLKRFYSMLLLNVSTSISWNTALEKFRMQYSAEFEQASHEAEATVKKRAPKPKEQKTFTKDEMDKLEQELVHIRNFELRYHCYLKMLQIKKRSAEPVQCDLKGKWKADYEQVKTYLKLVDNGRLQKLDYDEFLSDDADIWKLYDKMQLESGKLDFANLLTVFIDLIKKNHVIAQRFHSKHTHIVVDEYQDNSEVQAELLNEIVSDEKVTVVGDDDQCIYEFRGASPGNFRRLRELFTKDDNGTSTNNCTLKEEILVDNFRSSENILKVAGAFLEGCHSRERKELRATLPKGDPVELWNCQDNLSQARHIVQAIRKRHDQDKVPYGEMACLFRCFQMGSFGILHKDLQKELHFQKVPFVVVGGGTIFDSEVVRDLMAYLYLTITGSHGQVDDAAFVRVLNKPSRRLSDKVRDSIRDHQKVMNHSANRRTTPFGMEEAAVNMLQTGVGLSPPQKKALDCFFQLIHQLRIKALNVPLPTLLKFMWKTTGLQELHYSNNLKAKEKKGYSNRQPNPDDESRFYPSDIKILMELAERHILEWKKREAELADTEGQVKSLFSLAREASVRYLATEEILPQNLDLPQHLKDELYSHEGLGLPVLRSFAADVALNSNIEVPRSGSGTDDKECVTISTVHRAKGLEWNDVYVPYFNQGFMPTDFRKETIISDRRHVESCSARTKDGTMGCNSNCKEYFSEMGGARDRHADEERRLAHVAATRAKNRLIFVSVQSVW